MSLDKHDQLLGQLGQEKYNFLLKGRLAKFMKVIAVGR